MSTFFCTKERKVGFTNELDAKIALATRIAKDKGEKRHYACYAGNKKHFHLTAKAEWLSDAEYKAQRHAA